MLCEVCKIREANVQYTEVVGGVKTEHHFCSQCARDLDFGPYSAIFDGEFPFAEFLSALLGAETPSQKQDKYQQIVCPTCGMTYGEFVKNSCFGCADCYSVFDVLIHDNIKQLQGSESHKGKRPVYQNTGGSEDAAAPDGAGDLTSGGTGNVSGGLGNLPGTAEDNPAASAEAQIADLDRRLKDALRREEYETAALLRDRIRALKGGAQKNG